MQLQTHANLQPVAKDPFRQFLGAKRSEYGGEQNLVNYHCKLMFRNELASELVILFILDDEFDLVFAVERGEVIHAELTAFAAGRTFDVYDLNHGMRQPSYIALSAGFNQDAKPVID